MENIEYRKGAIDAANCISEGWNLVKPKFGLFVAMAVVYLLLALIAGNIPYAGSFINVIVGSALTCGIYMALLAQRRGEPVPFSLMFEGFSRIVPASLATLAAAIPSLVLLLVIGSIVSLPTLMGGAANPEEITAAFSRPGVVASLMGAGFIFLLISLAVSLLLFFALPLIADRNASIGDALKLSFGAASGNVGGLIALLIFEWLLLIAGFLLCCVGIIVALPIVYAANIVAYKSVFPDAAPQFNNEPPRPDQYGGNNYGTPQ